jgi:hypothetical protein
MADFFVHFCHQNRPIKSKRRWGFGGPDGVFSGFSGGLVMIIAFVPRSVTVPGWIRHLHTAGSELLDFIYP